MLRVKLFIFIQMLQVGFKACGEDTFEDVSLTELVSKTKSILIIPLLSSGVDRL